jgi:hypothetical protein
MDYVSFMRRVDGKPPKVEPKVDTSGFYYNGRQGFVKDNIACLREVLEGDCCSLSTAFIWSETPQGHSHWDSIDEGTTELTPADVQYLEWLLEEFS